MTIEIKKNLVSSSKYNVKCPYSMAAKYITIHNTYNDAPAANEVKYMNSNNNSVSFHYAVDDKEVIQAVPENRNAWHCGDGSGSNSGNRTSIGVEICYSKSGGERYRKAEDLAIKFIAQLLKERSWGIERVRKHQDWSGKFCPHRILDEGRWSSFKKEIEKELDSLNGEVVKKSYSPTPTKVKSATTSKSDSTDIKLPNGVYKKGDKDNAVKQIQEALNELNFKVGKADGIYGSQTQDAVLRFQKMCGIKPYDGIYGDKTRKEMLEQLK
ncbi:N-acetylmuramoyl-L-alanine amidase [Peribacillus asahii]|uniref:N-acetylmuramoyl-L-alanine amidase n=1 Tax=Peribacillus asahii TaxID=228899 RepID=A0A3Q9RNQ6_9BACI|nr:N-acetylmuramoyl-L-alanine amidase [Peribacillus asahii]AZV43751.1 N-acetylmuramoyl-L-alanine amidase [Peribacillus asahii]